MLNYLEIAKKAKDPTLSEERFLELMGQIHAEIPSALFKYISLSSLGDEELGSATSSSEKDLDRQKLDTLRECKIYLASPENLNDPFDCKGFFFDKTKMTNISNHDPSKGRDFATLLRIASLTSVGFQSMPMWAHYANNHYGICVEYDMNDRRNRVLAAHTYQVEYAKKRADITDDLDRWVGLIKKEEHKSGIFLSFILTLLCGIKNETWSYEQEYRCITNAFNLEAVKIRAVPSAIYIGSKCCQKYRDELLSIGEAIGARVYEMIFDNLSESYELSASPL